MTPETSAKKAINAYLNSLPRCWHAPYINNGYGKGGTPDRLVCYRGYFLAFEVKRDAEHEPTKRQKDQIAGIIAAGGLAYVVWSVEQVRAVIESIDAVLGAAAA